MKLTVTGMLGRRQVRGFALACMKGPDWTRILGSLTFKALSSLFKTGHNSAPTNSADVYWLILQSERPSSSKLRKRVPVLNQFES